MIQQQFDLSFYKMVNTHCINEYFGAIEFINLSKNPWILNNNLVYTTFWLSLSQYELFG